MSGLIRAGTTVQKGLALSTGVQKKWQHNRGKNPLAVRVYTASTGVSLALSIALPDLNSITLDIGSNVTVNVFVDWDVPTIVANSLNGVHGTTPPTNGFV